MKHTGYSIMLAVGLMTVPGTAGDTTVPPPNALVDDNHCLLQGPGAKVGYQVELFSQAAVTWDYRYHAYGIFTFDKTDLVGTTTHWFYWIDSGVSVYADWCNGDGHVSFVS